MILATSGIFYFHKQLIFAGFSGIMFDYEEAAQNLFDYGWVRSGFGRAGAVAQTKCCPAAIFTLAAHYLLLAIAQT
jgi:hypothetical protein